MKGNTVRTGTTVVRTVDNYAGIPNQVAPSVTESSYQYAIEAYRQTVYQDSRDGNKVDPNPYVLSVVKNTAHVGTMTKTRYGGGSTITETTSGYPYPAPNSIARGSDFSYDACVSALYEQLRGSLDLSVAIGEIGSTAKMFKAASKLSRYILQIHPKHWANHWLEYKYGWAPLMSDLWDTVAEVKRQTAQMQRFKARGKNVVVSKDVVYRDDSTIQVVTQRETYRTKMQVVYYPGKSAASSAARFASLNPASIVWELTPLSFVFDWFIDIGGYTRDLESSLIYSSGFHSGFVSRSQSVETSSTISGPGNTWFGELVGSCEGFRIERSLRRQVLDGSPRPQLPRFNPRLGASRLISAASLLKVLFLAPEKATPKRMKRTAFRINAGLRRLQRGDHKWSGYES